MERRSGVVGRGALAALGAHGLVVQVALLRELMAAHSGNEMSVGLALGVWVLAQSLGAVIGGRVAGRRQVPVLVSVAAAVLSAVAVAVVPLTRPLLGLQAGEQAGLAGLGIACLVVVALPALCHGALFVLGAARLAGRDERLLGTGYVWAGIGTVLAGLLVWLVLLERVPAFGLAAGAGALLVLAVLPLFSAGTRRRWAVVLPASALAAWLLVFAFFSGQAEHAAWRQVWPGQKVLEVRDSRLGKVLRLERGGEQTVVRDAAVVFRQPPANRLANEELALVPLLSAGDARRVLVCGPGFELAPSILDGPVEELRVVEPDPVLVKAVRMAADGRWMQDPRLTILTDDPRRTLGKPGSGWDLILVPQDGPTSLAGSRYFSEEFFRLCRQRLNPGGLLAMPGPGNPGPCLPVTRELLETRFAGLSRVFPHVRMVMLDFPLFLAGDSEPMLRARTLGARLARLPSPALDSAYLVGLLDPFRQTASGAMLADGTVDIPYSTDTRPRELFLSLLREARAVSGPRGGWLRFAGRVSPTAFWLALVFLLSLSLATAIRARRRQSSGWTARFGIPVLVTGFAGAAMTVLGVFVFQVRFGSVYSALVLLVAAFMAGTAAGGWLGNRLASGRRAAGRLFTTAETALALAVLLLIPLARVGPPALFAGVLFVAGAAVGAEFPLAASARAGSAGARLGTVTGLDLVGGASGSLLVAALLLPVLGLVLTSVGVALVKVVSLVGRLAAGPGD